MLPEKKRLDTYDDTRTRRTESPTLVLRRRNEMFGATEMRSKKQAGMQNVRGIGENQLEREISSMIAHVGADLQLKSELISSVRILSEELDQTNTYGKDERKKESRLSKIYLGVSIVMTIAFVTSVLFPEAFQFLSPFTYLG